MPCSSGDFLSVQKFLFSIIRWPKPNQPLSRWECWNVLLFFYLTSSSSSLYLYYDFGDSKIITCCFIMKSFSMVVKFLVLGRFRLFSFLFSVLKSHLMCYNILPEQKSVGNELIKNVKNRTFLCKVLCVHI